MGTQLVQLIINGLITGSVLALGGVGATLVWGILRVPNFAHGDYMALGAYLALFVNVGLHQNLVISAIAAMIGVAIFALLVHFGLLRPLRGRGLVALSLITVGLDIALQNAIFMIGGAGLREYNVSEVASVSLGPIRFAKAEAWAGVAAITVLPAVALFLSRTRLGKSMRAVASNRDLAWVSGINIDKMGTYVWILAGLLAGLAGVMFALVEGTFDPTMGLDAIFLVLTTVVLGSIGSAFGALVAGLALGVAMNIPLWQGFAGGMPSSYQEVVAFIALVLLLMFRPQGFFGRSRVVEGA